VIEVLESAYTCTLAGTALLIWHMGDWAMAAPPILPPLKTNVKPRSEQMSSQDQYIPRTVQFLSTLLWSVLC